jgi:RNA polymerase sigma-70 factor (ECF subfamily)
MKYDESEENDVTETRGAAWLTEQFERNRTQLRALAYRVLGSLADAEDAVQETWVRLSRSSPSSIRNIDAWLTTVAARVCLDTLKARKSRPEDPVGLRLPDPIVTRGDRHDPEQQALIGNSVGVALLVVIQALSPPERIAYVLHDMFEISFEDIGAVLGRSSPAARQLASRARRRVRGHTVTSADMGAQRRAVEAFFTAVRDANFEALLAVLDPDVVLQADRGAGLLTIRGSGDVAQRAFAFASLAAGAQRALVNGTDGIVGFNADGEMISVLAFTIVNDKVAEIFVFADRARLDRRAPAESALFPA